MKVLLIEPNYDSHVIHPPLGLGYLAAWLEREGHKVSLYNGTLHKARDEDFLSAIQIFGPDLIGISLMTRAHNKVKKLIAAIKNEIGDMSPVVIGGPQVTAAPAIVFKDLNADFAVFGEGELTLADLVRYLNVGRKDFKEIPGLVFKDQNGQILQNMARPLINNLDTLPYPAWHLMPPGKYRVAPILAPAKGQPIAQIMTGRGCPYNCSFCASNSTWKRKLRLRSAWHVLGEIQMLIKDYGVKEIHFCDDSFTSNMKRAEEICDAIIAEKFNIHWQCPNGIRGDRINDTLLKKMKKSGCYSVGLGVESGNINILKSVEKKLDLEEVKRTLIRLKEAGILSYGFFILGLPGDTRATIEETIEFALRNPFNRAWFNIFTPYPGSPAFNEWLGDRSFSEIDWDKHDCNTAIYEGKDYTAEELENYQKIAARRFYLRPKILLSVILNLGLKEILTLFMTRFFRKTIRIVSNNNE